MQVQSIGLGVIPQPVDDDQSGPEVESVYIPGPRGYHGGGAAGSNFAGDWDMSIGAGGGGAVMANDYNATRTATTIMASSTIVGAGTYRFAGSSSGIVVVDNPDAADNPCVIALTDLVHKSAAGDGICVVAICNSGATSNDLLALFNGETPANPVYGAAIQADCYADQVRLVGFAGAALDTSNAWQAADYSGTSGIHGIRYYYDTGTAVSFSYGADDFVVDVAAIVAAGQQLRVWAFCLPQSDTVNPTGFNYFLYDVGMIPHPAFPLVSDAVLPDGATDGNWYRVTGAGTFAGVDTVIGDYVKLIEGMTDIIAVHYGSDGAQGPQGDPGPAGADGAPGADGAQGDPGPTGPDGASAYEVAVANGFVGNEAAWLASLVGATGATGATGPQGPTGATGPAGGGVVAATAFTSSADFTMAAETAVVRVILIGAGGGGGSGGTSGAGVICTGGAGGGGAGKREFVLTRAEVLAAYPTGVVPVGIGAGGTAGASVTNAGTMNGKNGGQGGNTTFGTIATAYGGGGGGAGYGFASTSVGGAGGSQRANGATASTVSAYGGGGGASGGAPTGINAVGCGSGGGGGSATGGSGGSGVYAVDGGVGAAAGGGVSAANAASAGGAGGPRFGETSGASGGAGSVSGTDGTAGAAPSAGGLFGQGGGGGGSGTGGAGGAGGAGGRGSGGGGGGAARSTYATGAGGVGGAGWALVLEF